MQHKLLINGELVSGEGEKQPVYNPATGDVLLEIAEASAEQVDAAVRAADAAVCHNYGTPVRQKPDHFLR